MEDSAAFKMERAAEPTQWVRIGEWILVLFLATQMGMRTLPKAWHTLNTDFPNYYLTARLVHERYDSSRIYDWVWFQRQKDHRDIDQRLVGMDPLTPFSTLVVYPLTSFSALGAKQCWLVLNICFLAATLLALRRLTGILWRHLLLLALLSVPLRTNLLLGQYYVFLLFLLTLACWLYVRQKRVFAGTIAGLAAGLKVFPIVYLIYFLRKRDLKAFAGGVAGALVTGAISVAAFGRELNRIYLFQVMPSALRGEASDPYNLQASSLSSLLHRLFIYEPQLNQHPAINAPWLFAALHPVLQMALIAPAIILAVPNDHSPSRVRLEWAVLLLASLSISTSSTSYLFTLLILPVSLLCASVQVRSTTRWTAILLFLYVTVGFVGATNNQAEGWFALLGVPRLYIVILLCVFAYVVLARHKPGEDAKRDRLTWSIALLIIVACSIASNLHHQQGLYADSRSRVPVLNGTIMAVSPAIEEGAVLSIAMRNNGYHVASDRFETLQVGKEEYDELGIASASGVRWVEQTEHESNIIPSSNKWQPIRDAESPVASFDGRSLAFLREDHGRARIWTRALEQSNKIDKPLTPPELNVLEMSFLPQGGLIFAAAASGPPGLFIAERKGAIRSLDLGETRYPSVSPDGNWLVYSRLQDGSWNLWLRNLNNGQARPLTNAACNSTEPAWSPDSKTLVYASDCGRALRLSALCKRRIIY